MGTSLIVPRSSSADNLLTFDDGKDVSFIRCVIRQDEDNFYQATSDIDPFAEKLYINRAYFQEDNAYALEVKSYEEQRSYPLSATDTGSLKELFSALRKDCNSFLSTKTRKPLKNDFITISAQKFDSAANTYAFCEKKHDCTFFAKPKGTITDIQVLVEKTVKPDAKNTEETVLPDQDESFADAMEGTNNSKCFIEPSPTREGNITAEADNVVAIKEDRNDSAEKQVESVMSEFSSPAIAMTVAEPPPRPNRALENERTYTNVNNIPSTPQETGSSFAIIIKTLFTLLFGLPVAYFVFLGVQTRLKRQTKDPNKAAPEKQNSDEEQARKQVFLIEEIKELLVPHKQLLDQIIENNADIPNQFPLDEFSKLKKLTGEIQTNQLKLQDELAQITASMKEDPLQLKNENRELQASVKEYQSFLTKVETALEQKQRENEEIHRVSKETQNRYQELLDSNTQLEQSIASLELDRKTLLKEKKTARIKNKNLEEELDSLTQITRKKDLELQNIKKQLEELEKGSLEAKKITTWSQKETIRLAYERPVQELFSATNSFLKALSRKENQSTRIPDDILVFWKDFSAYGEKIPDINSSDYPLKPWKRCTEEIFTTLISIKGRQATAAIFNLTYWFHWIGLHENIQKEAAALMNGITHFYLLQGAGVHTIGLDDHIPETALDSHFTAEEFYLKDTDAYQLGLRKAYRKLLATTVEQNTNLLDSFKETLNSICKSGRRSTLYKTGFSRDFLRLESAGYSSNGGETSSKPQSVVI
jgi:large-conductance mechanosensitive channel